MRSLFPILVLVLCTTACHARFKKFARTADTVDLKVVVSGTPVVDLQENAPAANPLERAADIAVGAAAQVGSAKVKRRLEAVLQPNDVQVMVSKGAVETLGDGPPFGTEGDHIDGTIQIEVTSYGIRQEGGGPAFFANYRVRGYRTGDGKRIYKNGVSCTDNTFWTPNTPGNLVGTIATMNYLASMTDEELGKAVSAVVRRCTGQMIVEMRRHAG